MAFGNVSSGNSYCKICGELALTGILSGDVGKLRTGNGGVGAVSTKVVSSFTDGSRPAVGFCEIGVNSNGSLGCENDLAAGVQVDVGLNFAVHEVESEAAFNCFEVNICAICDVGRSLEIVATDKTIEVVVLAVFSGQVELVCGISNRRIHMFTGVNALGSSFNGDSIFLGLGGFATCEGCSKSNSSCFFRKFNYQLAIFNLSESVFGHCPSDCNVSVLSTNCGEINTGLFGDDFGKLQFIDGFINLFCGGLNNQFKVLEAIGAHRNEVRSAAVQYENTGSVCSPTEVLVVSCIDFSLLVSCEGGGEVGYVCTNVRRYAVQFELQILRGFLLKLLTLDFNALNGYGETNIVSERFAVCNLIGDVENCNALLFFANDSCGAALDFLHAGVRNYGTGNFNGHTDFDTIGYRVRGHAVAVVTALAVEVSEEEVVILVAYRLGVDSNYDTLNNNVVVLFCSHVIFKAGELVLRNGEVEGLGSGLVAALNGSGQNVCNCFGRLFVNVYDVGGVVFLFDLNLVGVNRPFNGVLNAGNSSYCSNFEVRCGNALVFVEVVNVICSCIYVINNLGLFFTKQVSDKITRCQGGYTESQGQQNY